MSASGHTIKDICWRLAVTPNVTLSNNLSISLIGNYLILLAPAVGIEPTTN